VGVGNEALKDVTAVFLAIVFVAVIATLVSRNANTTGVINSGSSAFNTGLATAEGPVTGYNPGPPIYAQGGFSSPELSSSGLLTSGAY
jgi:PRD1 phage membrane DNA delivery